MEEKEDSPTAMDCTSLTLVDAAKSQPASLLGEKQDLGDDAIAPHEDTFSAAPVAAKYENPSQPSHPQNQAQPSLSTSLLAQKQELGNDAFPEGVAADIAPHEDTFSDAPAVPNFENPNQPQNQAQPSHSASLMADNSSSGQEPKNHNQGQSSALADSNPEKWSHEAVVARSKARPWRMEKLKMAEQLRENPGVEFLMECWEDDPALRIVIKKLVAKFPQWGLVAVEGVLVKWDE